MEKIRIYEDNKESVKKLLKSFKEKDINKLYYMILNHALVHKSTVYDDYNEELIKEYNLLTLDVPRDGETIIGFPRGLRFFYFVKEDEFDGIPTEVKTLEKYFKNRNKTPIIYKNVLSIDGNPVVTYSVSKLKITDEVLLIYIIVDYIIVKELFNNVYKEAPKKIRLGLRNLGVDYNEILKLLGVEQK